MKKLFVVILLSFVATSAQAGFWTDVAGGVAGGVACSGVGKGNGNKIAVGACAIAGTIIADRVSSSSDRNPVRRADYRPAPRGDDRRGGQPGGGRGSQDEGGDIEIDAAYAEGMAQRAREIHAAEVNQARERGYRGW